MSLSLKPRDRRGITVLSLLLLIIAIIALVVALVYFWPARQAQEATLRSLPPLEHLLPRG